MAAGKGAALGRKRLEGTGWMAAALMTALSAADVPPGTATEQSPAFPGEAAGGFVRFDVPAQPLRTALSAFGRQAGLQVTVDAAATAGVQARAVSGELTPSEALSKLIAGSCFVRGGTTFCIAGHGLSRTGTARFTW